MPRSPAGFPTRGASGLPYLGNGFGASLAFRMKAIKFALSFAFFIPAKVILVPFM